MSSYTICLIRNSDSPMSLSMDLIVVNHDLNLTNKFESSVLIRTIRVRLPCCHSFFYHHWISSNSSLILSTVLKLTPKHSEVFVLALQSWMSSMPFPNFWCGELRHGPTFLTHSVQLTLVCYRVEKPQTNIYIYIYIYIYIVCCIYIYIYIYSLLYL